jgi:hypothetical protein
MVAYRRQQNVGARLMALTVGRGHLAVAGVPAATTVLLRRDERTRGALAPHRPKDEQEHEGRAGDSQHQGLSYHRMAACLPETVKELEPPINTD